MTELIHAIKVTRSTFGIENMRTVIFDGGMSEKKNIGRDLKC